jgi:hypothetical protein
LETTSLQRRQAIRFAADDNVRKVSEHVYCYVQKKRDGDIYSATRKQSSPVVVPEDRKMDSQRIHAGCAHALHNDNHLFSLSRVCVQGHLLPCVRCANEGEGRGREGRLRRRRFG